MHLDEITSMLLERFDEFLESHDIEYISTPHHYTFPCPIHDSDNADSLTIYKDTGVWKCWTKHCENKIVTDIKGGEEIQRPLGRNLFGFVRGLLASRCGEHVSYAKAIEYVKKFLDIKEDYKPVRNPNRDFVQAHKIFNKQRKKIDGRIPKSYTDTLDIPSQYFINRGFLRETMERYQVGFCNTKGKEMYQRVVVPVYDDNYEYIIGCVGRTTKPQCPKCGKYHYPNYHCPSNKLEKRWASKWINNSGFNAESHLYNYWFAKEHIEKCGIAILVEGQGDVWKLEESGIHIGLGIFGDSLTDSQKMILDSGQITDLVILTDNDEAGIVARDSIRSKCERYYKCHFVDLPNNDIGDMEAEEVKRLIYPVLEKV